MPEIIEFYKALVGKRIVVFGTGDSSIKNSKNIPYFWN
jgi:hypothetical protein